MPSAPVILGFIPTSVWWFTIPLFAAVGYFYLLAFALDKFSYQSKVQQGDDQVSRGWAPYVATPMPAVERMLDMCDIKPDEVVYDLGCGDGRFLKEAANVHGATAVGFEASEAMYWWTRFQLFISGTKNAQVHCRDFWNQDLSDADVVVLFLLPSILSRLQFKLRTELKPGARVVTYNWSIKGWKHSKVDYVRGGFRSHNAGQSHSAVYVYTAPFKKDY